MGDRLHQEQTDDPVEKLGQAFFFANSIDRIRQRVLLVQVGASKRLK